MRETRDVAALAGRDRLRRRERPDAGVAPGARAPAVPRGAVRVRAVLEQEDALLAAVAPAIIARSGTPMCPPMWTSTPPAGPCTSASSPRSRRTTCTGRRGCSRRTPARPGEGAMAASGVAMNVLDGHRTTSPRTSANASAAKARPDHDPNATRPATHRFRSLRPAGCAALAGSVAPGRGGPAGPRCRGSPRTVSWGRTGGRR